MSKTSLVYAVVAFLDILGFSRMVKHDAEAEEAIFLPTILKVLEEVRNKFGQEKTDLRMFSDSIVLSSILSEKEFVASLQTVAALQRLFLGQGILLRGGVAVGRHYGDDVTVFSEALVQAYYLEKDRARYPRVVVDENLWDWCVNRPDLPEIPKMAAKQLVLIDRDRVRFVHYLNEDEFDNCSQAIETYVAGTDRAKDTILEKMRWLVDYHNHCADKYKKKKLIVDGIHEGFSES